jgi:malonyl CoA-acyl carrier protein transacylase
MFPGQPLTFITPLPDGPEFAEIIRMTKDITCFDLATLSWTKGTPSEHVKLQVFGAAMSIYRNRLQLRQGVKPDIVSEHSMGIYPALAACGSISEEEALELTFRIGQCFAKLGEKDSYALGCVIGLTLEPLQAIAVNNGVYLANFNTSRHFLLSGRAASMAGAMAEAQAGGAFSAKSFPSDAPLHSPIMEEIALPLADICGEYRYQEPNIPLLNHINQKLLTSSEVSGFLVRELSAPVYWEQTYLALIAGGVDKFFETGAGDSLKKYNRWIDNEKIAK